MADMVVLVPSRGRPHNMVRLWNAWRRTIHAETKLVVGLDSDDPTRTSYPDGPEYVVEDGLRSVVPWVNHLAAKYEHETPYLGHIGDDNLPLTPGWDLRLIMALERTPLAFANDLYPLRPAGSLCCHVFMRSAVAIALGYFGPPQMAHMYVDNAWMAWGQACGISFLDDVIIEHLHFTVGKAELDEVYRSSMARMGPDQQNFTAYISSGQLEADIGKIRELQ